MSKSKGGNKMYYQQGDVIVEKCEKIDGKKLDHLVLETGEVTGHAHRISSGLAELFESGSTKYLKVISETATLTHEEHGAITLPRGEYVVRKVREYDHFTEESRAVQD